MALSGVEWRVVAWEVRWRVCVRARVRAGLRVRAQAHGGVRGAGCGVRGAGHA